MSKAAPYSVHYDKLVCLIAIALMVARRGSSVLIITGSNLKLIFQNKFFAVFFCLGTVILGQAESPQLLPEESWKWALRKRV